MVEAMVAPAQTSVPPSVSLSSEIRRAVFWPTLAFLPVFAALVALGAWQLHRLSWKTALIETVTARTVAPPVAAPGPSAWGTFDADAWDYRAVTASGRFDHAKELHVYAVLGEARGRFSGQGYWIVTPLVGEDGATVLVNRGFVPADRVDPATRAAGQIDGPVTITGLLRRPEPRSWFTPADTPAKNVWFVRDPGVMAAALGLPANKVAPYTIDAGAAATPAGGLPQAGETLVSFENRHLGYVITWWGLALCALAVFVLFLRGRVRLAIAAAAIRAANRG